MPRTSASTQGQWERPTLHCSAGCTTGPTDWPATLRALSDSARCPALPANRSGSPTQSVWQQKGVQAGRTSPCQQAPAPGGLWETNVLILCLTATFPPNAHPVSVAPCSSRRRWPQWLQRTVSQSSWLNPSARILGMQPYPSAILKHPKICLGMVDSK